MIESANKKYELTEETMVYEGHTLHRIKALKDFMTLAKYTDDSHSGIVKKGDLGGWVESEDNLSQEGDCWIFDEAKVFGNALVKEDFNLFDNAMAYDTSLLMDRGMALDNVKIYGRAVINGNMVLIFNNVKIYDNAIINTFNTCVIKDNAEIYECGRIFGLDVVVSENSKIHGYSLIKNSTKIYGNANICDLVTISNNSIVCNDIHSDIRENLISQCQLFPESNNTVVAYTVVNNSFIPTINLKLRQDLLTKNLIINTDDFEYINKIKKIEQYGQFMLSSIDKLSTFMGGNEYLVIIKAEINFEDITKIDDGIISAKKMKILDWYATKR